MNTEQMGGEALQTVPSVMPLNGSAFVRAGLLMWVEMRGVERSGPRLFQEMKELAETHARDRILPLTVDELVPKLNALGPPRSHLWYRWWRRSMPANIWPHPASLAQPRVERVVERCPTRTRHRH
jgi:hypothetical protein